MHKPAAKREQGRKPPIVEIKGENGDEVTPPPPEVIEPDPALSPEEAEQARKDYLLTRFWISARGFWGHNGDRLAWLYSIGLVVLIVLTVGFQYGINVWNRAIFDAIEKREATTVFHLTAVFFPLAIGSIVLGVAQVFARMTHSAPLARLADGKRARPLARPTGAIISSTWSAAITRTRSTASPRICASRPMRRSISSPA